MSDVTLEDIMGWILALFIVIVMAPLFQQLGGMVGGTVQDFVYLIYTVLFIGLGLLIAISVLKLISDMFE